MSSDDRTSPDPSPLLSVRDLKTYFRAEAGMAKAVDGVSFDVYPNEIVGVVGESGSGKSVTALSIMRLIPDPPGKIVGGEIMFGGRALLKLSWDETRDLRGRDIGMIFQEPMTSLNPVLTIGTQVMESVLVHERVSRREAFDRAVAMLSRVGIADASRRMSDYPHQFSGGMRQRVMIAIALVCHPQLLIADEPTTALDVTTQAQILDLMLDLQQQHDAGSILLITHDLAVVAETCHRVIVMYGGKVQEIGSTMQIFDNPRHPYTQGLLESLPARDGRKHARLKAIRGNVPPITELPPGCKFCTRCDQTLEPSPPPSSAPSRCETEEPPLHALSTGQLVRCHLVEPR